MGGVPKVTVLRVTDVTETDVTTVVEVPGPVSNHKGINLPGVAVSVPAMSEKDIADLRWGLSLGADMIALSFVRDGQNREGGQSLIDLASVVHTVCDGRKTQPQI